ncbi:MAG: cation:proton antiporter [Methanomassiliicoccales archaeon]|jgi:CPA2 family monovalent cation:H+ antiporter-2|nr:cation:proton antiporter [Methanomassiliicoccales archaeon]
MIEEYYSLVIIALIAFITPLLLTRTGIPVVVGEISFGLIVGAVLYIFDTFFGVRPLVFGPSVQFLATIGLIFLMFLSGLEIDFSQIGSAGLRGFLIGIIIFELTLILALPLVSLFIETMNFSVEPFYMAIILSTTSVAVVLSVIREMRISRTSFGQQILVIALISDIGAMLLVTVYAIRIQIIQFADSLFGTISMVILVVIFLTFFLIYKIGSLAIWHHPDLLKKFFKSDDPHEIGIRASLAIIFIFVAIAGIVESEAMAILGAFLAGAVISLLFQEGALLTKKLYGIGYGFLIPIFFINLGATFNFDAILNVRALALLPALILITIIVKIIPCIILSKRSAMKGSLATGVLLTGGLTLMIAASEIGLRIGILDQMTYSLIILVAIILAVLSPTLFKYLFKKFRLGGEMR